MAKPDIALPALLGEKYRRTQKRHNKSRSHVSRIIRITPLCSWHNSGPHKLFKHQVPLWISYWTTLKHLARYPSRGQPNSSTHQIIFRSRNGVWDNWIKSLISDI